MAKSKSIVYLGYEDEEVTEKHRNLMNSTVNKVGGCPDWPVTDIKVPNCPICSSVRPLLVQLYAPLENSQFHRTIYVFACLHPSCSNNSKGWLCLRTQNLDTSNCDIESTSANGKNKKSQSGQKMSWCSGADDWGDEAEDFNQNEENGNVIKMDNYRLSDDEDESNSMENDLVCALDSLDVDDRNANCGAQGDSGGGGGGVGGVAGVGAFGTVNVQSVCAEIEGGESDVVLVETPQIIPDRNLVTLLKESSTDPCKITDPTLRSFFLAVDEERSISSPTNYFGLTDHVRDLYQEYKKLEDALGSGSPITPTPASGGSSIGGSDSAEGEMYEKGIPVHGDIMFHNFLSSIQANPGQLIRYSRDGHPLLIAPLAEPIPKCPNCGGETICEIQILSTLIPKLRMIQNDDYAPIEYGNVLIFTCLKSCWDTPDKMRYESIIVQKEI